MLSSNYIYYTQEHFMDSIGNSEIRLLSQTKEEILDNAIKMHKDRIKATINHKGLSSEESEQVEDLLKGDWISSFNQQADSQNYTWASSLSGGSIKVAIEQLQNEVSKESVSIINFTKQLNNLISIIENQYSETLKTYTSEVIKKFTENKQIGSKSSKGITSVSGRILETLRSSYSGQAFRVLNYDNVDADKLSASLGKLAVLKSQLSSTNGKAYLKSLGSDEKKAFWKDVIPKVKKWLDDFNALVGEIGMIEVIKKGTKETQTEFKELQENLLSHIQSTHRMKGQSGILVDARLREDKRLYEDFNNIENWYGKKQGSPYAMIANASNSKADSVIQINENSVTGSIGFSTKEYTTLDITKSIVPADIHFQSNSTMLTLLLREANYSYQDLIFLINMAAATTDSPLLDGTTNDKYDAMLAAEWDKLKDQLLYRAFYATLAGLGGQNDRVFFLGINGRIISVDNILSEIRNNLSKNKIIDNTRGEGFNRNEYQSMNKSYFITGPRSRAYGEARSGWIRGMSMRLMQQTKIDISLRLSDLKTLLT